MRVGKIIESFLYYSFLLIAVILLMPIHSLIVILRILIIPMEFVVYLQRGNNFKWFFIVKHLYTRIKMLKDYF